jgi:hypothetical protein
MDMGEWDREPHGVHKKRGIESNEHMLLYAPRIESTSSPLAANHPVSTAPK